MYLGKKNVLRFSHLYILCYVLLYYYLHMSAFVIYTKHFIISRTRSIWERTDSYAKFILLYSIKQNRKHKIVTEISTRVWNSTYANSLEDTLKKRKLAH